MRAVAIILQIVDRRTIVVPAVSMTFNATIALKTLALILACVRFALHAAWAIAAKRGATK